jgi:hypothetical protein
MCSGTPGFTIEVQKPYGGSFVKKTLIMVCILALCNLTLSAQTAEGPRAIHTKEKSAIHVPPQEAPAVLKKIYTNLGSKTNLYNDAYSWLVAGPNSSFGGPNSVALPFTPKSNSHVEQVQVAVVYFGSGANQVNLSIYGDASGAPGTLLAGPVTVTNLPASGTCCALTVANFSPVAVTGGTQYWVVADSPISGTGSDFSGGWDWVVAPVIHVGINDGSGWSGINGNGRPAGEVLGTIP